MTGYNKKDGYYRKAKEEGYRSRAVYKLKQIDEKFGIFQSGDTVIDLGAAPGSWSEYALEGVGRDNVMAVDMERMRDIDGVSFLQGDLREEDTLRRISILAEDVDVVISDMAPDITGNYSMDHARSIYLAQKALEICDICLKQGGNLVVKVFQGEDFKDLLDKMRGAFSFGRAHSPAASRSSSSEMYIIGKGFKGSQDLQKY